MVRSTPLATHPSASQIHNVRYPGYGAVFTSSLACTRLSFRYWQCRWLVRSLPGLRLGDEGLPQVLSLYVRVDLAVDDHYPFGGSDPPLYPVQVAGAPHLDALRAHSRRDRREVGLPEAGEAGGQAESPEVVDLGAVAGVVHDHDEQGYAEVDGGVELAETHEHPAVPNDYHGQTVRPGDGRPHPGSKPEPDGLEGLGEDEARRVGDREVPGGEPREVAAVYRHGALLGEQLVEGHEDGARIYRPPGALVLELVFPAEVFDVPHDGVCPEALQANASRSEEHTSE